MTDSAIASGNRRALALFAIIACCIMFFIERQGIFLISIPAMAMAFLFLAFYMYIYFQGSRRVFLTSFYQIYFMGGLLISAASIAGGARMIEVGANGDANGAFWVILAFFLAGMEATALGFQSRVLASIAQNAPAQSWRLSSLVALSTSGLAIILSLYIFLTIGSPVLLGVDRVTFWTFFTPGHLFFLPSLVMQTYFFVAYYFLLGRKKEANFGIAALLVATYVLITVFILGQKFSAFVLIASAWLMVVSGTFPNFKVKASHALIGAILLVLLLALIAAFYVLAGQSADFIFTRIALQSQLMWSVLADPYGFQLMPSSDWKCLIGCGWYDNGKDYVSHRYLPQGVYRFYADTGTELSGFTPALPILTLGFGLAIIVHMIICFCLGILQREISNSVIRENIITSFLLYKVQLGLSVMWFGALLSAVGGSIAAAALLAFYLVMSGRRGATPSGDRVNGVALVEP